MGQPKALLMLAGQPILKYILDAARWSGATLLVTSPGRQHPPGAEAFDAEAIDPAPNLGPMRGILTALENARTDQLVVAAVDMPAIGTEILHRLAEELHNRPTAHAVRFERLRENEKVIEPLPAAFRKNAATMLRSRLAEGKSSLQQLAECQSVQVVSASKYWAGSLWTNLNSPEDLKRWTTALSARI